MRLCINAEAAKVVGDKPRSASNARKEVGKSCMSAPWEDLGV